jgi:hypothetical protein
MAEADMSLRQPFVAREITFSCKVFTANNEAIATLEDFFDGGSLSVLCIELHIQAASIAFDFEPVERLLVAVDDCLPCADWLRTFAAVVIRAQTHLQSRWRACPAGVGQHGFTAVLIASASTTVAMFVGRCGTALEHAGTRS